MKLRPLFLTGFTGAMVCVTVLTSCDGNETVDPNSSLQVSADSHQFGRPKRSDRTEADWGGIRTRANAAFAEMKGGGRARFESRIGLQPWPNDLPESWPTPSQARVVADSMQRQGDRLLLVDLPGSPGEALESYREELKTRGYHVVQPVSHKSTPALHAIRGDDEAILTFFSRTNATRLEILFVGRAS